MVVTSSVCKQLAGQNDVQPILHIPVVYENLPSNVPHWEYHIVSIDAREKDLPGESFLNELGALGWILVGTQEQRHAESGVLVHYYFMRQKSE
jgi:hypothetical protein